MTNVCRLILDDDPPPGPSHGAWQMAIDESLLRSTSETLVPTLRFYRWSPATLSIGYFQQVADRGQHVASQDCQLVRRASGGGAILHDREWTYSFVTPCSDRFANSDFHYLAFHETLLECLRDFQIQAHLFAGLDTKAAFLCFQRRSSGDVILGNDKIAGSAQRRWQRSLLQHGSVLLEASRFAPELPGLAELAGFRRDLAVVRDCWLEKLSARLKTEFERDRLADKERDVAEQLVRTKFGAADWTQRR